MDSRLNIRPEIIHLLEGMFFAIGLSNDSQEMTTKVQTTKAKINKWDYLKLKNFCTEKETINKMKGKVWKGRKYL